jgi:hypothetical protein
VIRATRLALTGFLLVAAFALSFDALRHQAIETQIIGGDLFHLGHWRISAHTLAGIWALVVDALAAVGIVGVREDAKDWKPWVALGLGLGFSFGFQVWEQPWPPLMRAVPPVALAVAVVVFELPRAKARPDWPPPPDPEPVPVDAPADPTPSDVPVAPKLVARTNGAPFTADQLDLIRRRVDQEVTAKAIQRELGISDRAYRDHLLPLVRTIRDDLVRPGGGS